MEQLPQVLFDAVVLGGFYAVMAFGLALIFGIMKIINLAHGEMLLVGAYLAWALQRYLGVDVLLALPLILVIGFALGWLISRVLIVRVVDRPNLMPLLVTFGIASVIQGVLIWVFSTTPRVTTASYSNSVVEMLGLRVSIARLVLLVASIALLIAMSAFLTRTKWGKAMQATAQNREAARIVGIDVTRVYCTAFGLGVALACGAGALVSVTQDFTPFLGIVFTIKAFVIVVLGGTEGVWGIFGAAMLLAAVEVAVAAYVPVIGTGLGSAVAFVIVVMALVLRPSGLGRPVPAGA